MRLLAAILITVVASVGVAAEPARRPNIVVILADDLGYGDVKCFNPDGKIATPNIDKLAAAGMRFTDAHSASAVCSPTRYGIMTGRYCWRTKLQSGVLGGLSPRLIEPGRPTVASLLKSAGYTTACVGKWHLGMDWAVKPGKKVTELNIEPREQVFNVDYTQPIKNGPNAVGFDYYFGISASLDMVPYVFIENDHVTVNPTADHEFPMRPGVNRFTRKGPTAPDFYPEGVLPDLTRAAMNWIAKCAEKPKTPFFLYLPLNAPHTPIAPAKGFAGTTGLGFYGDFVTQTDFAAGEVLAALDKHHLSDNTLVIFTSDNGCSPEADFPDLLKKGHNPSYIFRGTKADIYEGGHRIPFIVRWPGRVEPGTKSAQLVCLNDIFRTCTEAAGVSAPNSSGEDSFSIPQLRGSEASKEVRTAIVNHSVNGSFAIREGAWKLCLCPGSGGWSAPRPGRDVTSNLPPMQLFNMKDDIGEKTNVQDKHPEVVERLTKLLERYVATGRSTPGPEQKNDVAVDVWKAGKAAMKPPPRDD
jgi:arylsulfatase A-like enzyme